MKPEELSAAMQHLDDKTLQAADAVRRQPQTAARPPWRYWPVAAAAVAALAIAVQWNRTPAGPAAPDEVPDLPMLTIGDGSVDGMGFEGYMAYDIGELAIANPWQEDWGLQALPVYENTLAWDSADVLTSDLIREQLTQRLMDTAAALGLDTAGLATTDDLPDEAVQEMMREKYAAAGVEGPELYIKASKLILDAGAVRIEAGRDLTTIWFEPGLDFPEGLAFTDGSSYAQMEAVGGYLLQQYTALAGMMGMRQPTVAVTGGDRDIYARQLYHLAVYDAAGSKAEQLVQYHFRNIGFFCNSEGKLWIIRLYYEDLDHKVGDYPIISAEEARQLLLQGHYLTTVPEDLPGEEMIRKVELVYRTGSSEQYFMPYYRFYVQLPGYEHDGLQDYGAYYVPAVQGQYLTDMPTWDGSFN